MNTLIITNTHLLLVSDEEIKEGKWFRANEGNHKCLEVRENSDYPFKVANQYNNGEIIYHSKHWHQVIIGSYPQIDNSLSVLDVSSIEEELQKRGWFDVEKLAENHMASINSTYSGQRGNIVDCQMQSRTSYKKGFNKINELNKAFFTEDEMFDAFRTGLRSSYDSDFENYIKSLQESKKTMEVEIGEIEKCPFEFTSRCTQGRCNCERIPNISNNTIKIIKVK